MAGLIGEDGDTVTIVTCPPTATIASIHDRMPVILKPQDEAIWIDSECPFKEVERILCPYDGNLLTENVDKRPALL